MTPDDFLERLAAVRTYKRQDERPPHKALLLLLALGRIARGRERLVSYEELESHLRKLLRDFGPSRKVVHPVFPFRWLLTDELWDIPRYAELSRNASGDLYVSELKELRIEGGLPRDVYELLRTNPGLVWRAAGEILQEHFPESLHPEIREATGIPGDAVMWELEEALPAPAVREGRVAHRHSIHS